MNRLSHLCTLAVFVILVLVACGSDSSTSAFEADPGEISPDLVLALRGDVDPDEVPEVQRNFVDQCVKGGEDSLPELPIVQREGLLAVCGCVYDGLVGAAYDAVGDSDPESRDDDAFAWFTEMEDDLRADGQLSDEVLGVVRGCIRSEAGL